jgi:hypothetical protein
MTPGDLVIYHGGKGDPKPVPLLRFLSDRKALIRLAGQERRVLISSLRAIGGTSC